MSHTESIALDHSRRSRVVRRGRWLQYATLASCSLEAIVALAAGWAGHSVALVGFGLDSAIEVTSGAAVLWRLQQDHDPHRRAAAERMALRIVGWCFVALALYIAGDSAVTLWRREIPARSWAGIAVAVFSIVFMPLLARAKRRVAAELNSAAVQADSKQSELCAWLSVILLAGVGLNRAFGWWWADPVAGLAMVPIILIEGRRALHGKQCCDEAC
jgi:divalent metal cation (Fe/Co/Zn/Cd) transporter